MMQAMNNDLLNGAADQERDPNILRLATEHGAWTDIIDRVTVPGHFLNREAPPTTPADYQSIPAGGRMGTRLCTSPSRHAQTRPTPGMKQPCWALRSRVPWSHWAET